jgi:hypothetical protein
MKIFTDKKEPIKKDEIYPKKIKLKVTRMQYQECFLLSCLHAQTMQATTGLTVGGMEELDKGGNLWVTGKVYKSGHDVLLCMCWSECGFGWVG